MILAGDNPRTRREICPSAILSITNLTWAGRESNLDLHSQRSVNNRLGLDTALFQNMKFI